MRFIFISLLFSLSACGATNSYQGQGWPDSLAPAMAYYQTQAYQHNVEISADYIMGLTITFGDTMAKDPTIIGYCKRYNGSTRRDIVLNAKWWAAASTASQLNLLWHELGHCLLDQEHRGIIDPTTGNPTSIMYATISWPSYFSAHIEEYKEEYWKGTE